MESVLKTFYYTLLIIGFLALILRVRKLSFIPLYFLPLYFFILATQIANDFFVTETKHAYMLLHINQVIGAMLLHLYYYKIIISKRDKIIVSIGFLFFITYFTIHYLLEIDNIFTIDFSDFAAEGLLICIYSVLFWLQLYRSTTIIILQTSGNFWITAGNLIFFSGCMFVMGFSSYLRQNNIELFSKLVYINYTLNLLLYSIYIRAFLCNWEVTKS